MSHSSKLGALLYSPESSWAETSSSFSNRLPVLGEIDASGLKHSKIAPDRVVQYRNDGTGHIIGVQGGTFKTKLHLPGLGASTAGATALDTLHTLLGYVFGNAAVSASAGDTCTGGTASVPVTTGASGFAAGSMCRIGTLGDARGGGQFAAIGTHAANNLTLLTAIGASPNAADVVYSGAMIYPSESPTATAVTGLRFLLQTANLQYSCHGCFPISASFTGLKTGEIPAIEIEWQVSRWGYSTATFPTATTVDEHNPAPVTNGSFFVNDVGTVTRATRSIRDFTLDYKLGMQPVMGPAGVGSYQPVIGARRLPDEIKFSFSEDADEQTASPVLDGWWTATTKKHVLYTASCIDGSAMGFYFPRCCVVGKRPGVQISMDNRNHVKIDMAAYTGLTTTNDLTLSAFRMCMA